MFVGLNILIIIIFHIIIFFINRQHKTLYLTELAKEKTSL